MDREAAEKFTSGLGQVMGGSVELIKYAEENGVHTALGMTLPEWVNESLGGYVRLPVEDRRETAQELSESGLSNRKIATILGVGKGTIDRDLAGPNGPHAIETSANGRAGTQGAGPNGPHEQRSIDEPHNPETGELFDDPPPYEEVDPSDPASLLNPMPTQDPVENIDWDAKVEGMMPPEKKEELQRARLRYAFSDALVAVTSKLTPLKTASIAEAYTADEWDHATRSLKDLRKWIDNLENDRAKIDSGLRVIHRKDA